MRWARNRRHEQCVCCGLAARAREAVRRIEKLTAIAIAIAIATAIARGTGAAGGKSPAVFGGQLLIVIRELPARKYTTSWLDSTINGIMVRR